MFTDRPTVGEIPSPIVETIPVVTIVMAYEPLAVVGISIESAVLFCAMVRLGFQQRC